MSPDTAPYHTPPPPIVLPSLKVCYVGRQYEGQYRAYLSRELANQLDLSHRQPIDLIPPSPGSVYWYLDLRPRARRRVSWYADTRPRIDSIKFQRGILKPQRPLVLRLQPGEPEFAGYYPLLPDANAASK